MNEFEKFIRFFCYLGAGVVIIIMSLIVINIIVRSFHRPILGIPEIIEYSMVIVVAFSFAYTAVKGAHVKVNIAVSRFSTRTQVIINSITSLLSIGLFAVIIWRSALYGWEKQMIGERSPILLFPLSPFRYALAFGYALLCFALLIELYKAISEIIKK